MNTLEIIFEHKKSQYPREKISLVQKLTSAKSPQIIGEIKRGSPSRGHFAADLDIPLTLARYHRKNVAALSVLTDEKFFFGSLKDLETVRKYTINPILCKDFMISPEQIAMAYASGANVILLIAKMLPLETHRGLLAFAHQLGLEVLMEIHDEEDYEKVKDLEFDILGINNRDLRHFKTDVNHSLKLYDRLGLKTLSKPVISESGYFDYESIIKAYDKGFKGFLIGESMVKGQLKLPVQTKICGLKSEIDLENAHRAGADYVGFVLAESKRQISETTCKVLIERVRNHYPNMKTVVVVKDVREDDINHYHQILKPDYIQVHGGLPDEKLLNFETALIYATHISSVQSIKRAVDHPNVKVLLLDGSSPGSGQTFEWSELTSDVLKHLNMPLWVAGGLNIENVSMLIENYDIEGVDVSSGVEIKGQKEGALMERFIEKVRSCRL